MSGIVLVFGLQGTGKTTLASRISDSLACPLVTTEEVRKRLFTEAIVGGDTDFTPEELTVTYRGLVVIIEYLLCVKSIVVVDGVFRSVEQRQAVRNAAMKYGAKCFGIYATCADEVVRARLAARAATRSNAPGGFLTYEKTKAVYEAPDKADLTVDTSTNLHERSFADLIARITKTLTK